MQRRIIILLSCLFAATVGWSQVAVAQSANALTAEGERLAAAGDIKGALAAFEALTQAEPESAKAYASLGGMQLLDQRYSDAVQSFQRAITLGDTGTASFIGMGMAYLHMGQLGPARAAFVEAKSRGVENPADIDQIIAWIDTRDSGARNPH